MKRYLLLLSTLLIPMGCSGMPQQPPYKPPLPPMPDEAWDKQFRDSYNCFHNKRRLEEGECWSTSEKCIRARELWEHNKVAHAEPGDDPDKATECAPDVTPICFHYVFHGEDWERCAVTPRQCEWRQRNLPPEVQRDSKVNPTPCKVRQ